MKRIVILTLIFTNINGQSLDFDGSDDYVAIQNNSSLNFTSGHDYSITLWFKYSGGVSSAQCLLAKALNTSSGPFIGWQIFITPEGGGKLLFNANTGKEDGGSYLYGPSSGDFNDGIWHNVTVVYENSEDIAHFYFDGNLYSTFTNHGSYDLTNNGNLFFGKDRGNSGYFNGNIDEIAILDKALTAKEVVTLYDSAKIDESLSSNMRGYWKINEETGSSLADESNNNNAGEIYGASWSKDNASSPNSPPSMVLWKGNPYLSFDGNDDYVSLSNDIAGSYSAFTISSWVKVDDYEDANGDFILDVGSSGTGTRINLSTSATGFSASLEGIGNNIFDVNAPSSNTTDWQHVVFTWSGTDYARIFINGIQEGEDTDISSGNLTLQSGDSFNIGKRYSGGNYFPGDIDETAIWNKALTSSEITALYNSGSALDASSNIGDYTSSSNLIAYWKINEGSGTSIADASGNNNTGTISGATWGTVSMELDTINISQSNLTDTYDLSWNQSTDIDGDVINYLLYAQIGFSPAEEIYDTTSTLIQITYQELLDNVFEPFPTVSAATIRFSLKATDGVDTVHAKDNDRVLYVNRYEYLSTESEGFPSDFALHENYPNPFNPSTTLRFDLPELSDVNVIIYNMLGQKVRTFNMNSISAGSHSIKWNATNDYGDPVSAGVYLYQLQAKDFVKTRKMVLLK